MNILSQKGRSYRRGKPLQNDLRSLIIDAIVDTGGDIVTGYFQGNFAAIARTFKLKRDAVVKVWRQFVANSDHELPKSTATGVRSLQPNDLDFIEFLKTDRPSLTSG